MSLSHRTPDIPSNVFGVFDLYVAASKFTLVPLSRWSQDLGSKLHVGDDPWTVGTTTHLQGSKKSLRSSQSRQQVVMQMYDPRFSMKQHYSKGWKKGFLCSCDNLSIWMVLKYYNTYHIILTIIIHLNFTTISVTGWSLKMPCKVGYISWAIEVYAMSKQDNWTCNPVTRFLNPSTVSCCSYENNFVNLLLPWWLYFWA